MSSQSPRYSTERDATFLKFAQYIEHRFYSSEGILFHSVPPCYRTAIDPTLSVTSHTDWLGTRQYSWMPVAMGEVHLSSMWRPGARGNWICPAKRRHCGPV